MQDEGDQRALDALRDAAELYRRYLEVAKIAEIPAAADEEGAADYGPEWERPLGLTIVTSG